MPRKDTDKGQSNVRGQPLTRRRFVALAGGTASLVVAPAVLRAQGAGVIKIGHIQPFTGPSAAYGIRARDGAAMAVDEINAAGGWTDAKGQKYTLAIAADDMANDPKQAITLFRQYATDAQMIAASRLPSPSTVRIRRSIISSSMVSTTTNGSSAR